MFQGMIYNKHLIDQIGQTLHKKTIIDIGAHVGSFSFWFDFHCPGNTFYLYEPDKNTFDILQKNVWLNYKKKFHIFNICVAYKSGIVTFYSTSSKGQTQSSSILHRSANEDKYSINAKTLIDIITENKITQVDLVKMDCEGAEFDIILQAPTRLWAIVKAILFEYHDDISGKSHEQLVKSLKPFYNTIVVHPARYNKFRGTIFAKN
jgi:FkbM family methyltransferase